MHETFWTLLRDPAHWGFELLVGFIEMLVFDVLVGLLLWPTIRKHWNHHLERDRKEALEAARPEFKSEPRKFARGL
jgi:hypothetical protein